MAIFDKILRAGEGKPYKELEALAVRVNDIEPQVSGLSDAELQAKTVEFRERLANGEDVDSMEEEVFATVVAAIFSVIVVDAVFSIFFAQLGI